ncbi:sulfurtransferase TusA family protein [Methylobacterium sp. M6A4_1b]
MTVGDGETTHLDLTGLKCPLPVLRTRKALRRMAPGDVLVVTCTDPMSAIDIPHLVRQVGDALVEQERGADRLIFTIRRSHTIPGTVAENTRSTPH